jgi:hypothetical protein
MKASECKCCICGKQAVAFWPVVDPDIPSFPYCRECLDNEKEGDGEKIRKALIKFHKSTIDIDGIKGEDIVAWLEKQGNILSGQQGYVIETGEVINENE